MRQRVRHFALGPLLWRTIDTAEATDPLVQTAWQRGVTSAAAVVDNNRGVYGPILAVVFAVVGLFVGPGPLLARIILAAFIGLIIAWLVPTSIAAGVAIWAPVKQRDEARAQLDANADMSAKRLRNEQQEHLTIEEHSREQWLEEVRQERAAFDDTWHDRERIRRLLGDAETRIRELEAQVPERFSITLSPLAPETFGPRGYTGDREEWTQHILITNHGGAGRFRATVATPISGTSDPIYGPGAVIAWEQSNENERELNTGESGNLRVTSSYRAPINGVETLILRLWVPPSPHTGPGYGVGNALFVNAAAMVTFEMLVVETRGNGSQRYRISMTLDQLSGKPVMTLEEV